MRSIVLSTLSAVALLGCSSYDPYELPTPDLRDEIYLQLVNYGRNADCLPGDELLWEGLLGDEAPDECESCQCGPAACVLPSKVTAHASVCPGEDAVGTVDVSGPWDGSCAAATPPIQGSVFASVTFEPSTLAPCAPVSPAPEPSRRPLAFVRACKPALPGNHPTVAATCYAPQSDGTCWKEHTVVYTLTTVVDTRTCSPCTCGAPDGGKCAVKTTLYQDSRCFDELGNEFISNSDPPICSRVGNAPLAAMRSVFTQNEPGTCTPSVSTIEGGKLEPGDTHVLCCNL